MPRNRIEWLALAVSGIAILAVVGVLVVEGIAAGDAPPDPRVEVHLDRARDGELGWIVPATVRNDGDQAAEAVRILATARVGGQDEESEIEIDFLPEGTEVEVEIGFSARPEGEIELRLIGYQLP